MKKNIIAVLVCGLLCTQAMAAFADTTAVGATEELPMVIAAAPASYSISLNGSTLDLTGKTVYTKDGKVMIPLRAVAEKLGFTVTWDGEHKGVKLDNGEVNTIVYEGVDSYYMASSTAIGMSAPTELGAAPEIKEDTTYVPAELFAILYCNPDAVKIENGNIIIRSDVDEPEVGIPNPIKDYDTADAMKAAVKFTVKLPQSLPKNYKAVAFETIADDLAQVIYSDGTNEIYFRTAVDSGDISGDYNVYEKTETKKIGGYDVTLKMKDGKAHNATWHEADQAFSIFADNGLTVTETESIINSIK